jgi:RES domain-containing protein
MNLSVVSRLLPGTPSPGATYYRVVDKEFAGEMDHIGPSRAKDDRYSPEKEFGVLYLSNNPQCALKERMKKGAEEGRRRVPPQALGEFHVQLARCLDLTDANIRSLLNVSFRDLINPTDYSVTQDISREARRVGFEAILAPSAVDPKCVTLAIYKDQIRPPSFCIFNQQKVKILQRKTS